MRGKVTKSIKQKAKELLDIENISTEELRLMPYIQYVMMNGKTIVYTRMSPRDYDIYNEWISLGWITEGPEEKLSISKHFWDSINEILWLGYVDHD